MTEISGCCSAKCRNKLPPIIGFQRERRAKIKDGGSIEKENYNDLCRSAVSHGIGANTVPACFKLCQPKVCFRNSDSLPGAYPADGRFRFAGGKAASHDSFTEMYGILNSRGNRLAFSDDSAYYLLCALEILDDDGNFQGKADMFSKRTIQPHKCRYMDELTGGRGVIFATGTPVSNSMTELYTMQRYLQYDRLQEMGMVHFDCWASRFGETVTALELAPEGYTLVGR